jgi:FtsP/CotA-like multicopper oxidase with cupredoxin domain
MLKDEETPQTETGATRRTFLGKAMAGAGALALSTVLPQGTQTVEAQSAPTCAAPGQTLVSIAEIKKTSPTGPVQGVIKVVNENKAYLGPTKTAGGAPVCNTGQMRYLTGAIGDGPQIWPPKNGNPAPGPTIRARVGDTVEITLLNQVDVKAFGNSLDTGEQGNGCDVATSVTPTGSVNTYPLPAPYGDTMPDCFHGSSTANLHYHGTHVSPNILEDNVFVQLRPSPRDSRNQPTVNEAYLKQHKFPQIFTDCQAGHAPKKWEDLPKEWRDAQEKLLTEYDKTAVWQGKIGNMPHDQQLWPKDHADIAVGRWPQYYVGAYPSCFKLPVWNGKPTSMGQSPGTHWYHAHKHGSTALNLSNGMAGAFIVEGEYDDKLKASFNQEKVLVLQQFSAQVNLMRAPGTTAGDLVFVNGQYTPVIEMAPGEVQLWRIVNACHQAAVAIDGPAYTDDAHSLRWVQTAQDGVQLSPTNYQLGVTAAENGGTWKNATLATPMTQAPWFGSLAPGNRVDLLVKAPASGTIPVTFGGRTLLFTVKVTGNAVTAPTFPPPVTSFPAMPGFLGNLNPADVVVSRALHFLTSPGVGRSATTNAPPKQTINGKLFQDHMIDQTMQLGATEEWTLYNDLSGGPAHPFHIHINPFQVTEIKTSATAAPIKLPVDWIWWDTIAIPPGGYIKFLSRFVDYTGAYVLHCHILGHEDRGMMEMVQVIDPMTTIGHH